MTKPDSSSSDRAERVREQLEKSSAILASIAREETGRILMMADVILDAYRKGRKLVVCGNGGSAADAQHMAGELVGRFLMERAPLACIALTTDTSVLTAVGNDYGFEEVFSRQVGAHGREGDVLLAISTSGNSPDVLKAVAEARRKKMSVLALSGRGGGELARAGDVSITVPSPESPRIQEGHGAIIHVICDLVEHALFGKSE